MPPLYPVGRLAFFAARYPCLWLALLPPSPDPLPLRGRGSFLVYFAGGFAPGTPVLNRLRHWLGGRLWYLWGA